MFDKIQMILMMKMSISNNRIARLNNNNNNNIEDNRNIFFLLKVMFSLAILNIDTFSPYLRY